MISRRSVRVKVMQLLYMLNRDEQLTYSDLVELYKAGIGKTYELYLMHLYLLLRVTQCAEEDAKIRAQKVLPSEEDQKFSPRLYRNPCIQSLANNLPFLRLVEQHHLSENLENDLLYRLYQAFSTTEAYKHYLSLEDPTREDHIKVLLELYRFLVNQDLFVEIVEDRYSNWADDESLVVGAMKKTIKAMPLEGEFYREHEPSDETVREFGEQLLRKTCQEDRALYDLIAPMLKNWDPERVAVLDMIMLKMAVCELLHFPTIPVKVTINEFVEISKAYSTENSREFINGVLDRLMKRLKKEGRLVKEGRGLLE
ncbi:MAG: transcription antitermination factor NusB [Saprospiraceae bacterium]|nr:transcription antitermination factor NusB [Saprospiraceae bacterium]MDW8482906.1 transcription antitermination factor NusB [Saprospiraceae bacterium]